MKVVLLVDSLGFGGAQRQIANLAVELKRQGDEVSFVRYREDNFYLSLLNSCGIEPITVQGKNIIQRALKIRKTIRSISPDAVISFMDASNIYAGLSSLGKHRWQLFISERVANETAFSGCRGKFLKGFQGRTADKIICNSKCAEQLWKERFPKYTAKLDTIYNIIDVPPAETGYSRDGKCRILIAARYEPVKNAVGMIKAVSKLKKTERERLEIHWYGKANIVKDGLSELDKGKALIHQLELSDCVFLHPATNEIYPLIAKTDFIGLFSFAEGLPNSIIEGMSYKKPVIMSKVSDYDVLTDYTNGFLCDPTKEDSIAEALRCAVHTDMEMRKTMGECSYEKISRLCSRTAVLQKWNELLKS